LNIVTCLDGSEKKEERKIVNYKTCKLQTRTTEISSQFSQNTKRTQIIKQLHPLQILLLEYNTQLISKDEKKGQRKVLRNQQM